MKLLLAWSNDSCSCCLQAYIRHLLKSANKKIVFQQLRVLLTPIELKSAHIWQISANYFYIRTFRYFCPCEFAWRNFQVSLSLSGSFLYHFIKVSSKVSGYHGGLPQKDDQIASFSDSARKPAKLSANQAEQKNMGSAYNVRKVFREPCGLKKKNYIQPLQIQLSD